MNNSPSYYAIDVTPEMAAAWLECNTHNRTMNERSVATYAGAMARGEWRENGETITFSRPPRVLLDGQKRLLAVVRSGCRRHHEWIDAHPADAADLGLHGWSWSPRPTEGTR